MLSLLRAVVHAVTRAMYALALASSLAQRSCDVARRAPAGARLLALG